MAAEMLALSKFKLQLVALVSEVRHLREGERSAREELEICNQRKQSEVEYGQKLQEMRLELAFRDESLQKLGSKLKFLENENALLEKKEKELKETIRTLLESREAFLSSYEESTCSLKRSVEMRDRKLSVLSEKIQAHVFLLDSITQEATIVKQMLDNVQHLVVEKEQVVTGLKEKMDGIAAFEKDFVEKICFLEHKLIDCQNQIQKKDVALSAMEAQLETERTKSYFIQELEELRVSQAVKDEAIHRLVSEKQALHIELKNLEAIIRKIQDFTLSLSFEEQKAFSALVEGKEQLQNSSDNAFASSELCTMEKSNQPSQISESGLAEKTANAMVSEEHDLLNAAACAKPPISCTSQPSPGSPQMVTSNPPATVDIVCINRETDTGACITMEHYIDCGNSACEAQAKEVKCSPEPTQNAS